MSEKEKNDMVDVIGSRMIIVANTHAKRITKIHTCKECGVSHNEPLNICQNCGNESNTIEKSNEQWEIFNSKLKDCLKQLANINTEKSREIIKRYAKAMETF